MLNHRSNTIVANGANGTPIWGASYVVYVGPVGAVVTSTSNSTTVNVQNPHSLVAGDKFLQNPGSSEVFSEAISSVDVSAGTITMPNALSVTAGDLLFNLGPDTGTTSANYDAIPGAIYSDPDGGTAISNNKVTADSTLGTYDYWHRGDGMAWELFQDTSNVNQRVVKGWSGLDRLNICDFGASARATGGVDDSPRIQAAIDHAEAAVNANSGVNFDNVLGQVVYCPAGDYRIATALTLDQDGVEFIGAGKTATTFYMTEGTGFITLGNGSTAREHNTIREFTCTWNDDAYSGVTFNSAVAADTTAIYFNACQNFDVMNVRVYFDENNVVAGLRGFEMSACERFNFRRTQVYNVGGPASGTNYSIAYLIDGGASNHGNVHLDSIYAHELQVGVKMLGSGTFNAVKMTNLKLVNSNLNASHDPKYGIWLQNAVREVTITDLHVEGWNDGGTVTPFDIGVWLDSDTGAVDGVACINSVLSQCTTSVQLDGSQTKDCRFWGTRIFGNGDHVTSTVFSVGANVSESSFIGCRTSGTVTAVLSDSSAAESHNTFMWDDSADTQEFLYKGDGTFDGDVFKIGDVSVDADSQLTFQRASGGRSLKWQETEARYLHTLGGLAHGRGSPDGDETGVWEVNSTSEEITGLSASPTDTASNRLFLDSIVEAVLLRITTTISGGGVTSFDCGDPTTATRFKSGMNTLTAGTTYICLDHKNPTVTDAAGPVQTSNADVRFTFDNAPTAGAIRVTVLYKRFDAPSS